MSFDPIWKPIGVSLLFVWGERGGGGGGGELGRRGEGEGEAEGRGDLSSPLSS